MCKIQECSPGEKLMAFLLFVTKIGKAEIRQWNDTKLYNVKYTNTEGKIIDMGDFKTLIEARKTAYRYMTGTDSGNVNGMRGRPEEGHPLI